VKNREQIILHGLAKEFRVRSFELDLLAYHHFCLMESAIHEAAFAAQKEAMTHG
jgi:hypothetical protein